MVGHIVNIIKQKKNETRKNEKKEEKERKNEMKRQEEGKEKKEEKKIVDTAEPQAMTHIQKTSITNEYSNVKMT